MNMQTTVFKGVERIHDLRPGIAIGIIVLISLAVKLGYLLVLGGGIHSFPTEGSDVDFYYGVAQVLLKTGVYGWSAIHPTTEMPPGETYFLAGLAAVSNNSFAFMKFAHIALLTAVAVLVYLTGKKVATPAVGFWAGVLIAIDPAQAYLASTFLSDALFIFWMTLGIYLLVPGRDPARWGQLLGVGICFALAGLTRNQGWLFAAFLLPGALITRGRMISLRSAALVLLVTVGVIAPWTIRNYLVSGHFIPVSSEGGLTLWASNNPEFVFRPPMPMSLPIYEAPEGLLQNELDLYYRQKALTWILENPGLFWLNGFRKVFVLYNFDPMSWRGQMAWLYRLAGLFPYGLALPFIVVGMARNLREQSLWVVYWYILFTTLLTFVFYGDSRIRAPIQPYLYLFGVLGVRQVFVWWQTRRRDVNAQLLEN